MELTQRKLKDILSYDPESGLFHWRKVVSGPVKIGQIAGTKNSNGHIMISISRKRYVAHRLAWLYMTGKWPTGEIDHVNVIGSDNRWNNLRLCTRSENECNKGLRKDNTSGFKGVCWNKTNKKWIVKIKLNNKTRNLGGFNDIELADLVAREAREKYHGLFARHN
ncbi:HNH endonuclease [Xenorhabdus szentirmaii]|uniref:HNH endonuclease n=1 Tax=Xenorhabdus szentirmaii TaxID=290112 RepID=UPI000C0489E6|nr:HNH endonuclease [Xenorhabdus szentirmaii]PHM42378.1 hypothetical protein Xszus_02112 [Xenorhabdus szentirmaii]